MTQNNTTLIRCDVCDAREELFGEITERTLEDDGWYLGATETLCPDHANTENE